MKRSAKVILEYGNGKSWVLSDEKITCEVIGEMSDGVKIWQDTTTKEQYFCCRMLGKYYFYKG